MPFEGFASLHGIDRSIMVIIVSEIGDKTFLIAAILAMRHPRLTIFSGSLLALALMSLLSSLLGQIMPALLPKRYTTAAAALLFFVFGTKMLQEGLAMDAGDKGREKMEEEMREVQKEVEEAEETVAGGSGAGGRGLVDLEEGRLLTGRTPSDLGTPSPSRSLTSSPVGGASSSSAGAAAARGGRGNKRRKSISNLSKEDAWVAFKEGAKNLAHLFFSPIFIQAFVLTFLAEWGDRSQITTIALAAAHNVWLVTLGTTLGHGCCTMLAVLGGRWISQHISIKHVTLGGAVLFLIFGLVYAYEAWHWVDLDIPELETLVS